MMMTQAIMQALFASDEDFELEQQQYNDYLYENSVYYNLSNETDTFNELKADHEKWIGVRGNEATPIVDYSGLAA
jgi:hypothetical protein